ncbi:PAS domain-containing sensor histidine kinase [Natrarchaeobaculum aegyptiacum]|uniref:histidine kinase n=1 Tax=Natrarchaeobaculum aegyptiacum TaxID=745377 RepID=A0A2Z2HPY8_9EURY|nr:PAS domain-containing sensor histidine kinase [Natrarchaeobaculum aegyptiacum]ARS89140.1 PAS domain-containing sensor histidine kinase [Natrarchaeobaculum aegyptiacum]
MTDHRLESDRLIERISDGYCAVDATWRITNWNDRMAALTGTRPADGEVLWKAVPTIRGTALESHCRLAMETHESRSVTLRCPASADRVEVTIYADEGGLSMIAREIPPREPRAVDDNLAETVFENTQDALFLVDVDDAGETFRLERVNPVYEAHTGLTNEELAGEEIADVFGDEQGRTILENYRECVVRREPLQYEEAISVPEEDSWWETRITPVIVDGTVEKIVGATRNVTERKARERQYDAIFNQTYQFTGLVDLDGTLLEANDSALEFGGFDREDVVGNPVWETGWWRDSGTAQQTLKAAIETASDGEFVRYDETVRGSSGTVVIDFSLRPIADDDGNVVSLVAEGRNITEHKRRAEELEQKREFLGQIQRVAAIGGWEVDFRTGTMRWTEEVYRIHGVPLTFEPTVQDGVDFYHPEDRATVTAAFERLKATGEGYDVELRIVTADDEVRWVRTLGTPWYDDVGKLVGARGAFQDVTERTERERALQRTNDRLEAFTAVVSHDLRNPLTVAQAALELARESHSPDDFDRLEAAHVRMNALITDLLTLARNGQQIEQTRSIALTSLVESVRETIPGDDATIEVAFEDDRLEADESRLRQLFENLLSNALVHGGEDVTIRVGPLANRSGFYVADDGPGIPPERRSDVFDRGVSTTGDGTGFGLAIVREIAGAHGWTVDVTESADGGARFEVTTRPDPRESIAHE